MKPDLLAYLVQDLDRVANRLISLKEIFPDANVSLMVAKQPDVLLKDSQTISEEASKVGHPQMTAVRKTLSNHVRCCTTSGEQLVLIPVSLALAGPAPIEIS